MDKSRNHQNIILLTLHNLISKVLTDRIIRSYNINNIHQVFILILKINHYTNTDIECLMNVLYILCQNYALLNPEFS